MKKKKKHRNFIPLIGTIQQITVVIHSPVTIREVYVFKASDPGRFFGFFE
jgi:hypothetical protein